jgi:CheY-like chemotaxis protein
LEVPLGSKEPYDLRGLNILIVDDDANVRDPLEAMLNYCGALVTPASSPRAALAWLEARQPDLIISDLGMPGEDGFWFVRQVRGLSSPVSTIPAVALTGFDGLRDEAKAAGFNAYLVKPLELAAFSEALQRLGFAVGKPGPSKEHRRAA